MPRIRKDSETLSNCGYSTISRTRRESDRLRNDLYAADNPNATVPRNISSSTMIREVYEREKKPNRFDSRLSFKENENLSFTTI